MPLGVPEGHLRPHHPDRGPSSRPEPPRIHRSRAVLRLSKIYGGSRARLSSPSREPDPRPAQALLPDTRALLLRQRDVGLYAAPPDRRQCAGMSSQQAHGRSGHALHDRFRLSGDTGYPAEGTDRRAVRFAARVQHATKTYGMDTATVTALDDVTAAFAAGEFTAIMGPSGSGKSTLMHCMAGLDELTSGQAFIGETDLASLSDRALTVLRRDRLGFVFQAFNLIPTLTASENITLPADLAGRKVDRDWYDTIVAALEMGDRLDHRPAQLSGGQQQRTAVARALVSRPEVVFADEPTGALDSKASADLLRFLRSIVDDLGQTVVMVTHDPVAAAYADRVVFLADGAVVEELEEPTRDAVLETMKRLAG